MSLFFLLRNIFLTNSSVAILRNSTRHFIIKRKKATKFHCFLVFSVNTFVKYRSIHQTVLKVDRLLAFVDLDHSQLEDSKRESLFNLLEGISAATSGAQVVFAQTNGEVVQLENKEELTGPKTVVLKSEESGLQVSKCRI